MSNDNALFNDIRDDHTSFKAELDYKTQAYDNERKADANNMDHQLAEKVLGHDAENLGRMLNYSWFSAISEEEYEASVRAAPWEISNPHVKFYNLANMSAFLGTYDLIEPSAWTLYHDIITGEGEKEIVLSEDEYRELISEIALITRMNNIIGNILLRRNVTLTDNKDNINMTANYNTKPVKQIYWDDNFNYIFPEMKNFTTDFLTSKLLNKNEIIKKKSLLLDGIDPDDIVIQLTDGEADLLAILIL